MAGAYALAAHGRVRATGDIDVWVHATPRNAARVFRALTDFGAPLQDLSQPGVVFQIGVAPVRIDILTGIDGVDFGEAWASRFATRFAGLPVNVLSVAHLIQNKKAAGRPQDLADVDWLENPGNRDR